MVSPQLVGDVVEPVVCVEPLADDFHDVQLVWEEDRALRRPDVLGLHVSLVVGGACLLSFVEGRFGAWVWICDPFLGVLWAHSPLLSDLLVVV